MSPSHDPTERMLKMSAEAMPTPNYADDWLTVYHGDARTVMAGMEPESVHCVVTSPPYWGLRDYGTATWIGGDETCDHKPPHGSSSSGLEGGNATQESAKFYKGDCCKCGATRQDDQLGLESTPEAYVESMVAVFREVRRVLRSDGTAWLNLGDSYAAQRGGTTMVAETIGGGTGGFMPDGSRVNRDRHDGYIPSRNASAIGLKHKDLIGIPWRVAFALQADGWYLRSDIIWHKPNPMPESVTDRPTKSHEYMFLLSKSPRYYFDADAVREAHVKGAAGSTFTNGKTGINGLGRVSPAEREDNPAGRNIRSVWTIATQPYPGAHFATFPQALVEPCIKAGTSERGVCPECGAPWERVVEWTLAAVKSPESAYGHGAGRNDGGRAGLVGAGATTTGWRTTCAHDAAPVPAVVLDPFAGSGTTGLVAQRFSRRAVLIDLNSDYLDQLMARNRDIPLGLV